MAVDGSWIPRFFGRFVARIRRPDWPDPSEPFWDDFERMILELEPSEVVAEEATYLLAKNSPQYLSQVIKAFESAVRRVWASSEVSPTAKPVDPESEAADARARAKWAALPEHERQAWRDLVRGQLPGLNPKTDAIAMAWHDDPTQVTPVPPPYTPPTQHMRKPSPPVPFIEFDLRKKER